MAERETAAPPTQLSRRRFLRSIGSASLAIAAPRSLTSVGRLRGHDRPTVVIFGGGVAGLTAAHELAERGFDVTVYERRAWGGKARSMGVPDSARGGRRPLPAEHGHRVEFGFYQCLPDTMRRIPFGSNPNGVFDNLVGEPQLMQARDGGRRDLVIPADATRPVHTPAEVIDLIVGLTETELPPDAVAHFANRFAVYLSSCDSRRLGEWERTPWSVFIGADRYPDDYSKLFASTFSDLLQASAAERTSANFVGRIVELVVYNLIGRGSTGPVLQVLNAPTNEAWIDPWIRHLRNLGVRLRNNHSIERFELHRGRVVGARMIGPDGRFVAKAEWYVCALPVERARELWSRSVLAADPNLASMREATTGWMNGIQFYLREPRPLTRGHVICADSPWLVSSYSQGQFWARDFPRDYGDGTVRDCISAIASDWHQKGVVYGKAARYCTPDEVAREVWVQMQRHLNDTGDAELENRLLHSWYLDPGLVWRNGRFDSEDPLVLPTTGTRRFRPDVKTNIPNLLLTGDYLDGQPLVANMEVANYNSRRAVNALLERSGSNKGRVDAKELYRPPEWEAAKAIDEERYERGRPNLLDIDATGPLPSQDRELVRQLGLESILERRPVVV